MAVTHPTVAAALEAARAAGEIAMKYYRGGFEVTIKADQTPVTQADREAEKAIRSILARATPGFGFLGEELGEEGSTSHRWIIDPIDGTKNFVRHIPIWAVLIALEEEGQVTTGVVHNPVTGELFWARKGEGAWAKFGNLKRLVDEIAQGFSPVTAQTWPAKSPAFDKSLEAPFYDPAKAKDLLKQAAFSQARPLIRFCSTPLVTWYWS
jgi:histidinol-phosphatase